LAASCQVQLEKRGQNNLDFIWIVPKNDQGEVIFAEIPNYLFNQGGEWYEVFD
jgi:hypothetical protein